MRTLVCVPALLVFLIANLQGSEAQCGGFQVSCENFFINGTSGVFRAQCKTYSGAYVSTSIDLNKYISNENGNLQDNGTNFSQSCQNEGWVNAQAPNAAFYIVAECSPLAGTPVSTFYDISDHVVNSNGILSWNNC